VPELPEVEVVRAGLAPVTAGATVASVTVLDERALRRHPGPAEDFADRLTGRTLLEPRRRGKFLWVPLADEEVDPRSQAPSALGSRNRWRDCPSSTALLIHLGMSGQILLRDAAAADARHTRVRILVRPPGREPLRIDFADQRTFGSLAVDTLVPTPDHPDELVPAQALHIARDPLDPHFDDAGFFAALARRDTAVKRALLDQTLVSGVGNIYADEALWAARVHPEQSTRSLSRIKARALLSEVRAVFAKALDEGGTSFDELYRNVNGEAGYFAHSLNAYGQQGLPCARCGRPIVRVRFMNRGSHFCPRCQRSR
jgi:formamidopyrimidine-DNA glycosylase